MLPHVTHPMLIFPRTRTVFTGKYAFHWGPTVALMVATHVERYGSMVELLDAAARNCGVQPKVWIIGGVFICNGLSLSAPNRKSVFVQLRRNPTIVHAISAFQRRFRRRYQRALNLAVMMAFHPRLGARAGLACLDVDIARACIALIP